MPIAGILFTVQQTTGITLTLIFAILSLLLLLYRWKSSDDVSYLTLIPLFLFIAGTILPWFTRTEYHYTGITYKTYISPFLGNSLWQNDNFFLTIDSVTLNSSLFALVGLYMIVVLTVGCFLSIPLSFLKTSEFLIGLSLLMLGFGFVSMILSGGLPWFGFWSMLAVPPLSHLIKLRTEKKSNEMNPNSMQDNQ